jgi:ketosteroid isomerase-like protein
MDDVYHDRFAIADLFNRYAAILDQRQWDRLADLYTADATAELPEGEELIRGNQAIASFIQGAIETIGRTHHFLSNHVADIDGDRATASCYLRAYHAGRDKRAHQYEESLGRFDATLVRTPEGWRLTSFVEVIFIMLGTAEVFQPQ